ncbi:TonB-dependent receptor plug domain-containing protein [Aestuariivivens sediminicola]|uniref:TonB-dependent receptor plug domain-containing protein n=1 Tax=Aestuariivivens sediminicola TaxID=2913560 RepID=UPI001F576AB1|nr:TonB-dependent receptor [Aestuariivivens sediminicola]
MKPYQPTLFFLLMTWVIQAQQIKVLNKLTQEPVYGVAIYNTDKSKSVISNFKGEASLDRFTSSDLIFFQHLTHVLKTLKKEDVAASGIIYLESNTQGLNEIVVSQSKFEQNKRDIPQKILSINKEEIAFANPQTSADLLGNTGQVFIQKSQLGGGSPMIRGFSTNRLLITVDGVRMNNAIFRGGNVQNVIAIDPFSIQRTEVNLGAGSVIYGSDAIGGVMGFYTQKPQLAYSDTLVFKSNATLRYASANHENTGHIDFNLGYRKWAFYTSASYSDFGDLRMGKHGPRDYLRPEFIVSTNNQDLIVENDDPLVQKYSGYNQINLLQKIRHEAQNNLSFDLGLYYTSSSDIPRYDRLIRYRGDELRSAEWYYGPQKWFMSNLLITKLSSRSNLYDKIKATLAYQNFQESRVDRDFQSDLRHRRAEKVDAYSMNFDFEKRMGSKTGLFYGLEYVYNKVHSNGFEEDINTNTRSVDVSRYPDGATWQSAAIYSSLKYKPNVKFVFQSGLRFNHVVSKANFQKNNTFLNLPFNRSENKSGALTGTAGLTWLPNSILEWRFNASSAFRAPNIDDIGKVFDSEPGSVVVPNENLKPEYAYGGELGVKLNFKNVVLDMSSYYTYLDNALVRRDYTVNGESQIVYDGELSNVQAIQNASKAWIYGFEIGLDAKVSRHFNIKSQYSIVGGTEENEGIEVPVRHAAPNFGNTHLIYTSRDFIADVFLNYNGELSFNQLTPSEAGKAYIYASDGNGNPFSPSWTTLNLRTQYKINDDVILSLSAENITDQRYRPYSSGITAPGRNYVLSLKYSY